MAARVAANEAGGTERGMIAMGAARTEALLLSRVRPRLCVRGRWNLFPPSKQRRGMAVGGAPGLVADVGGFTSRQEHSHSPQAAAAARPERVPWWQQEPFF